VIIGGAGGMAWTGEGGSIPGWRESYLHVIASGVSDIMSEPVVKYSAVVEIIDTAGATIEIPDVSYFSTTASKDNPGSCSITIQDRTKWSPRGTQYPNLLQPSDRKITVKVTTTIRGTSRTTTVFSGNITGYTEAIGRSNDAINLNCKVSADQNKLYLWSPYYGTQRKARSLTKYRTMLECQKDISDTLPIVVFTDDAEQTTAFTYWLNTYLNYESIYSYYQIFSQLPTFYFIRDYSAMAIKPAVAVLTDDKAISLNWSFKQNKFNSVRVEHKKYVTGPFELSGTDPDYPNGYYRINEKSGVVDQTDAGVRGTIAATSAIVNKGATWGTLIAQAKELIWDSLADEVTAQIRFEPDMVLGRAMIFDSARLNLAGNGYISSITHSYSTGNISTSMQLKFRTIAEPNIYVYLYYYKVDKDEYEAGT
jgi:hypothetical protein